MQLLLTSAGLSNNAIVNALCAMAKKPFSELNLVFIPTAANMEKGDKGWLIDDLINCKKQGFASIDIVDISAIVTDVWMPRIDNADVLLFGGGNVFHLMYWLEKSGLAGMLPEMLKTKIYVGISAGSMVTSPKTSLQHCEKIYYEDLRAYKKEDGLGLVSFQIRPHYNSPDFPNANEAYLEELSKEIIDTIYAIDDNTAIKIIDDHIEIISEGTWRKFN